MIRVQRWVLFSFFSFYSLFAQAVVTTCIQGSEKKTQIQNIVVTQAPDDSFLRYFQVSQDKNIVRKVASVVGCATYQTPSKDVIEDAAEIQEKSSQIKVKRECFVASMKREHGTDEFFCPSSSSKGRMSLGVPSDNGQCLTDQIVDYTSWAFHEVISCMSDPKKPIDPLTLFALMNNESAFHFYVASKGGVGIGQLTTSAIDAVNNPDRSGSNNYIEQIKNSDNPHCAPFKKALAEPLKNSYAGGYCPLLQPSGGFARSLVYSVSYYLMTRDTLMTRVNSFLGKKGEERASFYNYAALAMYGPTALNEESHVIQAYTESKGNFTKFMSAMRKKIPYVANTLKSAEDVITSEDTNIKNLGDCLEP